METGFDIIFFWVARMMMMGIHFMGEVPFDTVLLHAMVRDEKGQKMSKTKGNVIDPLDVSEEYGADSLRIALASMAGHGRDIKLSMRQVEAYRNFINKVYNASRFALMNLEDFDPKAPRPAALGRIDGWILTRLERVTEKVDTALEKLAINDATLAIYHFFWNELCDWYIELAKPILYSEDQPDARRATQWTLVRVLDSALRLLHPFIPFASEEIWARLPLGDDRPPALVVADYPKPDTGRLHTEAEADVETIKGIITAVRNIRGELSIPPGRPVPVIMRVPDERTKALCEAEALILGRVGRLASVQIEIEGDRPRGAAMQLTEDIEVFVPLAGLIDFAEELGRLEKALAKEQKAHDKVQNKLANPRFVDNAPEAIVAKERGRLEDHRATLEKLQSSHDRIAALAAEN